MRSGARKRHSEATSRHSRTPPVTALATPFELKWWTTTKTLRPRMRNSPASGLREFANALFVGSMRPGLADSRGPEGCETTVVEEVAVPPARS